MSADISLAFNGDTWLISKVPILSIWARFKDLGKDFSGNLALLSIYHKCLRIWEIDTPYILIGERITAD